jgi:hypothetical protein
MKIDKKRLHINDRNYISICDFIEKRNIVYELLIEDDTKIIRRNIENKLFGIKLYLNYFKNEK